MHQQRPLKVGLELIMLYDPPFWNLTEFNDFYNPAVLSPEKFWDRALDTVADTGVDGIEITWGPGNWQSALTRYGSGKAFKDALDQRGLELCSCFVASLVVNGGWHAGDDPSEVVNEITECSAFLADAGCDILITGLPLRRTWNAEPPMFVDHAYAEELAGVINAMGYAAARNGVRLAIHPEAHAVFWLKRDIDLFLSLTDPVYVWFCPDTCHITLGRGDPVEIMREHKGRLLISHWKDARGAVPVRYPIDENVFKSHHPFMARMGEGQVDWHSVVRLMREISFSGWAVLELDAAADPPMQIREAAQFADRMLRATYE